MLRKCSTVLRCERREEMTEFGIHLGMESGRRPPAGVGRRYTECTPVTWHRRSFGKAAALGPVDQAGERGFLHAKTARQFGHSSRAGGQDAQKPCLDGSEVMVFGDARIMPCTKQESWKSPVPASAGLRRPCWCVVRQLRAAGRRRPQGRGRLCAVVHTTKVHGRDS